MTGPIKFDTQIQLLKNKVLSEIAARAFEGTLLENVADIPEKISPGKTPTFRCCVYKERAVLSERIKYAIGGHRYNNHVMQIIDIACNQCPMGGYEVMDACRGCLAHRCEEACKRGAISFGKDQKAFIDKSKCVECGMCAKVCPYNAITNYKRPCEAACKTRAIEMDEEKQAKINEENCIACGACAYQCPFGAITDVSSILDVIDLIKSAEKRGGRLYAVIAPSIGGQFTYAKPGQVLTAILKLGFTHIAEAAAGADMVALSEAKELTEKGFLLSSCCPSFVSFIKKEFPELAGHISHNLSPAATIAKKIKESDPDAHLVFIGPCTSKKNEVKLDTVSPYLDTAITFEELQALFDSRDIHPEELNESGVNDASYYGRSFARSGGLTGAVAQALKEQECDVGMLKAVSCSGIEECRKELLKVKMHVSPYNFIEGMACVGGCINGAGCLTHGENSKTLFDRYNVLEGNESIRAKAEKE